MIGYIVFPGISIQTFLSIVLALNKVVFALFKSTSKQHFKATLPSGSDCIHAMPRSMSARMTSCVMLGEIACVGRCDIWGCHPPPSPQEREDPLHLRVFSCARACACIVKCPTDHSKYTSDHPRVTRFWTAGTSDCKSLISSDALPVSAGSQIDLPEDILVLLLFEYLLGPIAASRVLLRAHFFTEGDSALFVKEGHALFNHMRALPCWHQHEDLSWNRLSHPPHALIRTPSQVIPDGAYHLAGSASQPFILILRRRPILDPTFPALQSRKIEQFLVKLLQAVLVGIPLCKD